jgi:hypothetical protein
MRQLLAPFSAIPRPPLHDFGSPLIKSETHIVLDGCNNLTPSQLSEQLLVLLLPKIDPSSLIALQHLTRDLTSEGTRSDSVRLLSCLLESLSQEMVEIGFSASAIFSGIAAVLTTSFSSATDEFHDYSKIRSALLEHLCLAVDEISLPQVRVMS